MKKPFLTKKTVEHAPAHSEPARRFRFPATGCWVVGIIKDGRRMRAESGHATRDEALSTARALPWPWTSRFAAENPTDAAQ